MNDITMPTWFHSMNMLRCEVVDRRNDQLYTNGAIVASIYNQTFIINIRGLRIGSTRQQKKNMGRRINRSLSI